MHRTSELSLFPAGTRDFMECDTRAGPAPDVLALTVRDSLGHEMRAGAIELPRFAGNICYAEEPDPEACKTCFFPAHRLLQF